jgi:hypothetical protein
MKCSNGTLSCVANKSPSPEICDGLDNNCNGQIDEGGVCDVTPPKPEPPPPHPEPTAEPPPPHPEPTAEIAALEEIPSPAEQATAEFSDHDGATTADASAATDNALPDYAPLNDDLHSTDNAGTSQTPDDLVGEDLHRVLVIDTHSLNAPIYQPRGCGCQSHQHPSASLPFGLIPIILVLLCVTWRRLLH